MVPFRVFMDEIYNAHKVPQINQARIKQLQDCQGKQSKSDTNSARKQRLTHSLFIGRTEFLAHLNLYRGILPQFQGFVKLFQSQKPLMHKLHAEMFVLTRDFLSFFIKPDSIPADNVKELLSLDVTNEDIQFTDKHLVVGQYAYKCLLEARQKKEPWVHKFYQNLRQGYMKAGTSLAKKLPLSNKTIMCLTALSPFTRREPTTAVAFEKLAHAVPNIVPATDIGTLLIEVRKYSVDSCLDEIELQEDMSIDSSWWAKVFNLKKNGAVKYPVLGKLVKALLSIFTGPLIEGTFNIMDDIVESDRAALTVENYEALSCVKYGLKARSITSLNMDVTATMKRKCLASYQAYKQHLVKKKQDAKEVQVKKLAEGEKYRQIQEAKKRVQKMKRLKALNDLKAKRLSVSANRPVSVSVDRSSVRDEDQSSSHKTSSHVQTSQNSVQAIQPKQKKSSQSAIPYTCTPTTSPSPISGTQSQNKNSSKPPAKRYTLHATVGGKSNSCSSKHKQHLPSSKHISHQSTKHRYAPYVRPQKKNLPAFNINDLLGQMINPTVFAS